MGVQDFMPKDDWVVCVDTGALSLAHGVSIDDDFPPELADRIVVLPRTPLLELACRYKQLVVYVVITQQQAGVLRTLVYQRQGKQEGEQRLAGKFSVGVGGHVEVRDLADEVDPVDTARPYVGSDTMWQVATNAALRELDEELLWPQLGPGELKPDLSMFTDLSAWMYTPQDQVGRAHIGLVFYCKLPPEHETPVYGPGQQTLWLSELELSQLDLSTCETWTAALLLPSRDNALKFAPNEPTLADLLAAGAVAESNPAT